MGRAGIFPRTNALAALLHLSVFRFGEFTSLARVTDAAAAAALHALPDGWVSTVDAGGALVFHVSDLAYAEIQAEVRTMTDIPELQPVEAGALPPVCLAAAQTLLRRLEGGEFTNDAMVQHRILSNLDLAETAINQIGRTVRFVDSEAYRRELRIARARLRQLIKTLMMA